MSKIEILSARPAGLTLGVITEARLGAARRSLSCAAGVGSLVALVAAPWLVGEYTISVLSKTLVLGLLAATVALLTGVCGAPTLGQTAPFAVGAYVSAQLAAHGYPAAIPLPLAAAAAGAAFAAVTAPLVVYARGVVTLMVTLAIGELTVVVAGRWRSITGGGDGLYPITEGAPVVGLPDMETDRARYLYVLAVVFVTLLGLAAAVRSPASLPLRAARDDEARARASGHRVNARLAGAFVIAGAIAGLAGSLLFTTQRYVSPADFEFETAALLLLAVVLGGTTSIVGAASGAVLVFGTRDWVANLLPGHGPLLLGTLFVVTAYLLPDGFAGAARGFADRLTGIADLGRHRWIRRSRP